MTHGLAYTQELAETQLLNAGVSQQLACIDRGKFGTDTDKKISDNGIENRRCIRDALLASLFMVYLNGFKHFHK